MADNWDDLEHRYAAKQHLVHSIRGTHKEDFETGILNQRPTVDITRSNRYQVHAQVDKFISHFIQSARDNITELNDLHCVESDAERLESIDSLRADNKYLFPVAECVEGGVRGPNRTQRESTADNEYLASTLLPGGSNPAVFYIKFYHRANNRGKYADRLYYSMINDKDGHIPSPLIIFRCTALQHALLE